MSFSAGNVRIQEIERCGEVASIECKNPGSLRKERMLRSGDPDIADF
jgi:hypothetical protein